jgi:hypothetical protein
MIYHDISSHINYYGTWEKQTRPGVKPGWESPNVIEEVCCSESYGGLNGEMSSLQSLHHFSIARSSKYPEAIFFGKIPEPPRFHGQNPWLSGFQIFRWKSCRYLYQLQVLAFRIRLRRPGLPTCPSGRSQRDPAESEPGPGTPGNAGERPGLRLWGATFLVLWKLGGDLNRSPNFDIQR